MWHCIEWVQEKNTTHNGESAIALLAVFSMDFLAGGACHVSSKTWYPRAKKRPWQVLSDFNSAAYGPSATDAVKDL